MRPFSIHVPRTFPEAKLKGSGLISLVEESSRQPNIDCHTVISNHTYADYSDDRVSGTGMIQKCSLEEKATGKHNVKGKACAGRKAEKRPRLVSLRMDQIHTGVKERASFGQNSTELSFYLIKEDLRNRLLLERHDKQKLLHM